MLFVEGEEGGVGVFGDSLVLVAGIDLIVIVLGVDGELVDQVLVHLDHAVCGGLSLLGGDLFILSQPDRQLLLLDSIWLDDCDGSVGDGVVKARFLGEGLRLDLLCQPVVLTGFLIGIGLDH